MKYADLAGFFERLEGTPGRLGMTTILVEMLDKVPADEMVPVVRLLQGAVAPDWEGLEVGLAEKQILKVLAMATGASAKSDDSVARIEALYREKGDLGLAAEDLLKRVGGRKQASLFAQPSELGVKEVFDRRPGSSSTPTSSASRSAWSTCPTPTGWVTSSSRSPPRSAPR